MNNQNLTKTPEIFEIPDYLQPHTYSIDYLKVELHKYEQILNEETFEFLFSCINLEVSVLSDLNINHCLGGLKFFRELAAYNIIHRTESSLKDLPVQFFSAENFLNIIFRTTNGKSIPIFKSEFNVNLGSYIEISSVNVEKINAQSKIKEKILKTDLKNSLIKDNGFDFLLADSISKTLLREHHDNYDDIPKELGEITSAVLSILSSDWHINLDDCQNKNLGWINLKETENLYI